MTQILEGTWDEIAAHKEEWNGKRLRVAIEILETPNGANGANGATTDDTANFSLAERLRGRTGRVAFEPEDVAVRAEEYFGQIVEEKHELRRGKP